jgi:phosphate transport system permease protein
MKQDSMALRHWVNRIALGLTGVCALLTVSTLFFLLGYIALNGIGSINWEFLTQLPKPVGEVGGGMANAIVGTAKLLLLASLIGVPVGFFGGVYLSEYGHGRLAFWVRYASDVLNGVPSIVIGIFAYILIVLPMKGFSTLAGGFALGIMMIPIAVRTTEEFLRLIPASVREASYALGVHQWKTTLFVVIPAAARGLMTGILLDLARVAGETAPLLFTALNNRIWSHGWTEPTSSLPVMIYTYAISPYEDWHRQAWAAALILMLLVLAVNGGARVLLPRRRETA